MLVVYEKGSEGKTVGKIASKSNKVLWKRDYGRLEGPDIIYYMADSRTIYGENNGIIMKYDSEGNLKSKLIDCKKISDVEYIDQVLADSSEGLYVAGESESKLKFIKYVRADKKINNKAAKELIISAYAPLASNDNNSIANLAKKFEKKHPEIKIKFEIYDD